MKIGFNIAGPVVVFIVASWFAAVVARGQQNNLGVARNGVSHVEYYGAPHQQQMKSRLSGAEASPEAGGLLEIKQLKLEMFDTNGVTETVVEAPECLYDTMNGVASSAGHLKMRTGDGNLRIEGDGFLWRQKDQWLTISNHVQTVIKGALESETDL